MAKYFFDINDGENRHCDADGLELADREAARREAISTLPDVAREELPDGNERTFVCLVRDESGNTIFEARLSLHAEWLDQQGGKRR
jgi:hypothetical protein